MQTGLPEKLPNSAWGTKGFAFWTFLSVLLEVTRPRALLEVGCGRSSTFFADYAYAHKAAYVGIENDVRWFNKVELDIGLLGFNTRHLTHVPPAADGSWYDLDAFRAATNNPGQFDFAFIDGPNEKCFFPDEAAIAQFFPAQAVSPFGHRDNPTGLATIKAVTRDCDLMMVDDVHKEHVFNTVDQMLSDPDTYEKHYFIYHPYPTSQNALNVCLKRNAFLLEKLPRILDFLGLRLERNYRPTG